MALDVELSEIRDFLADHLPFSALSAATLARLPEQLHVEGKVSAASDVWALGLIAFDALTGGSYWRHYGQYPAILAEMEVAPIEAASARVRPPCGPTTLFQILSTARSLTVKASSAGAASIRRSAPGPMPGTRKTATPAKYSTPTSR